MLTYLFAYLFLVTAKSHTNQLGLLRRRSELLEVGHALMYEMKQIVLRDPSNKLSPATHTPCTTHTTSQHAHCEVSMKPEVNYLLQDLSYLVLDI